MIDFGPGLVLLAVERDRYDLDILDFDRLPQLDLTNIFKADELQHRCNRRIENRRLSHFGYDDRSAFVEEQQGRDIAMIPVSVRAADGRKIEPGGVKTF